LARAIVNNYFPEGIDIAYLTGYSPEKGGRYREGKVKIDDLVREFRDYYVQRINAGQPLERDSSLMARPAEASDLAIKRLIITNPLERFLIKNFIEYFPEEGVLQIAPQLWKELHHYEVLDALKSADEQISYYIARYTKRD